MSVAALAGASLEDLIARIALAERAAFDHLYKRTSAKLFAVAMRILSNEADAEEAVQETYVKIWGKAGTYAPTGAAPMSWLISIARNTAVDILRRKRKVSTGFDDKDFAADDGLDPEQAAALSSDAGRLRLCLDLLEPARADLIKRAYFSGRTYAELSNILNAPLGTIKSWIRRSLMKLRECLEAPASPHPPGAIDAEKRGANTSPLPERDD